VTDDGRSYKKAADEEYVRNSEQGKQEYGIKSRIAF
jgi:hypothetical protein